MLDKGLTAIDFAEDAYAVYEAEQKHRRWPDQAVAWLKCGLGIGDDVQPIPLTPMELAEEALDRGLKDADYQMQWDTRNDIARQRYQTWTGIYGR